MARRIARIIHRIKHKEEGMHSAERIARYELDVVELQNSIIADLAEANRLLLEELESYRAIEDEDKHLLTMMKDIEDGKVDLKRLLEP